MAFLLHSGAGGLSQLAERAAQAARAARRCTVLWMCSDANQGEALEAFQNSLSAGTNIVLCDRHQDAVEHMCNCAQRLAAYLLSVTISE